MFHCEVSQGNYQTIYAWGCALGCHWTDTHHWVKRHMWALLMRTSSSLLRSRSTPANAMSRDVLYKATQHSTDDSKPRKPTLVEIKPSAFCLGFASLHIIMRLWVSNLLAVTAPWLLYLWLFNVTQHYWEWPKNHLFLFDAKSNISKHQ